MLHEEVLINMRFKLPKGDLEIYNPMISMRREPRRFNAILTGYSSTIEGISCSSLVMAGSRTTNLISPFDGLDR